MTDFRAKRRMEMYLEASKAYKAFKLTCSDFCNWDLSHIELYDDFKQRVKDALYSAPGKWANDRLSSDQVEHELTVEQLSKLKAIKTLFEKGHYFEGCKKLRLF